MQVEDLVPREVMWPEGCRRAVFLPLLNSDAPGHFLASGTVPPVCHSFSMKLPVPSSHSLLLHEVSLPPPVSPSPWSPSVFLCLFLFCFLKEKAPLDSVPILIQDLLMWVLNYIDWNDIFFPNRIYSGVLDEDISGEQDSIPWVLKGRSRVCSGAHLRREGGLALTAIITVQGQAEQAVAVGLAIEWAVKVFCRQVHTVV